MTPDVTMPPDVLLYETTTLQEKNTPSSHLLFSNNSTAIDDRNLPKITILHHWTSKL